MHSTPQFDKRITERRIVTNGKVFRVQHLTVGATWADAIWHDYATRDEAQRKLDELNAADVEVWEPV